MALIQPTSGHSRRAGARRSLRKIPIDVLKLWRYFVAKTCKVVKDELSGLVCRKRSSQVIAKALAEVLNGHMMPEYCAASTDSYRAQGVLSDVNDLCSQLGVMR